MDKPSSSSSAPGAANRDRTIDGQDPAALATPKASRLWLLLDEPIEPQPHTWIEKRPRRPIKFDTNEYLDESA